MKEKILYAVIGALLGAIITTAIFLIFRPADRRPEFQERGIEFREDKEGFRKDILNEKEMNTDAKQKI